MLDALTFEHEQVGGLAQMLTLGGCRVFLLHGADFLDDERVVGLHVVVPDVEQILFVDEHSAQIDSQHEAQVARIAVHLHVFDALDLVALPVDGTESAANLLVVEQKRIIGLIDVVGLEKIHVFIAAQLAEVAEGHVVVVARQAHDVLVRAYDHDVVWSASHVILACGRVVAVVGAAVGALHLHDEHSLVLHLALEHGVGHALCLGKHFLRVHARHLLRGVNHVGDENRDVVAPRFVEELLEDGGEIGR